VTEPSELRGDVISREAAIDLLYKAAAETNEIHEFSMGLCFAADKLKTLAPEPPRLPHDQVQAARLLAGEDGCYFCALWFANDSGRKALPKHDFILAASAPTGLTERNFHNLRVWVENDWVRTKFTCTAPEGSFCRMRCTDDDCELWDELGDHTLVDAGKCQSQESFECYDWLECHESTGYESKLYDGPVDAFWDGEDFQWRILESSSAPTPETEK